MLGFPTIFYALSDQASIVPLYTDLKKHTKERMTQVLYRGFGIISLSMSVVAIFGMWTFSDIGFINDDNISVFEDTIINMPQYKYAIPIQIGRFIFFFQMILSGLLNLIPLRDTILTL